MLKVKFRPCIDIHSGKVKQIVGSTLTDEESGLITNFETELSPAYYAEMYKKDKLTGGHVIMLGPGNKDAAFEALQAFPGGLQIGGGITPDNAAEYISAGASHVIVTSYVFNNGLIQWERLDLLKKVIGAKNLVLDLSCKKREDFYYVVTDRWQKFTEVVLSSETFEKLAAFCDEFLIHAADVEGKRQGVDEELIRLLSTSSPIPVTYAGGVRSVDDLEKVRCNGGGRVDVTIGSALDIFGGNLSYQSVVSWINEVV